MIPEPDPNTKEGSFLRSALTLENRFQPLDEVRAWLRDRQADAGVQIEEIPLERLTDWETDVESGDLFHTSGKFFRVHGVRVRTNFPGCPGEWDQPIINQPEIGLLGIVTRVFDGVRYFLMQAKMEPGNINRVQLSPTVQATRSNFTQVHGGKTTQFLDLFLGGEARVLVDQLQSEQGTRFLRKRNRNMIVEVDSDIPDQENLRWLTLGELKCLLQEDDRVNMDTRTILSCIPLVESRVREQCGDATREQIASSSLFGHHLQGLGLDLFHSLINRDRCTHTGDEAISWLTRLKTLYTLDVSYLPLNQVRHWVRRDGLVRHETTNYFSVIGVAVRAHDREVDSWSQPILKHEGLGLVGVVAQRKQGVLHFLVQAKVEPGIMDVLEMGPTVSIWDIDRRAVDESRAPFLERFLDAPPERVHYDRIQSEEGGRFYHLRNRYMLVELPEGEAVELPENFTWMTLGQIMDFVRLNNYFNIEARGLLACLGLLP